MQVDIPYVTRDLFFNNLPLPWIASTEPEERYIAKRKRKEELLNNMMMLLAPSFLNPCILPLSLCSTR